MSTLLPRSVQSTAAPRCLAALFALAMANSAAASEPVLLPDFSAQGQDDWVIAAMVQGLVVDRLVQDGMIVLTSDLAARVVPAEKLQNCAPSPVCPQEALNTLPARMATVVSIQRLGTTLVGHVELFTTGQPQPSSVADIPIVPGNEHLFAVEVSRGMQALFGQIGPSPDNVLLAAARLIAGQPVAPPPPPEPMPAPPVVGPPAPVGPPQPLVDLDAPAPRPAPAPAGPVAAAPAPSSVPRVTPKKGDGSTPHTAPLESVLDGTGVSARHLVGSEQAFLKSGLDPRDFMFQKSPHAGRLTVQIGAALGVGDVDRSAVALALVEDGAQINAFYEEGPDTARRVRGDLYVGFAPATMVDLGVLAGLQYSGRDIRFQRVDRYTNSGAVLPGTPQVLEAQAVQVYVQPRVRAYLVPLGPAKPYLTTGAEVRVMNGYKLPPSNVDYLLPSRSAVIPGWVGGGGLMIDPGPIVGLYAEGSYTHHFGAFARPSQDALSPDWTPSYTPVPVTGTSTVAIGGGVQFRL